MNAAAETTIHGVRAHAAPRRHRAPTRAAGRYAHAYANVTVSHLLRTVPSLRRELQRLHTAAELIGDPALRRIAQASLNKRGNLEGAALLATLAPGRHRAATTRALIAYQAAYNYLDALSELPGEHAVKNAERMHRALLDIFDPAKAHTGYLGPHRDDDGYLHGLIATCRAAFTALPSAPTVAPLAHAASARIARYQTLSLQPATREQLEQWARTLTPPRTGLHWWETAAAAGSSLPLHALIAAAANPGLTPHDAHAVDHAYFPHAGALHSLLDSLVDRDEDHRDGRLSLLGFYRDPGYMTIRLATLALIARQHLTHPLLAERHRVILTAMCSYYLSAPQAQDHEGLAAAESIRAVLGPSLPVALHMFAVKRLAHAGARVAYL